MTEMEKLGEELPDVAALYLDEAIMTLEGLGGVTISVMKTLQPRERSIDIETQTELSYRVVRCEWQSEKNVMLTVAAVRDIRFL